MLSNCLIELFKNPSASCDGVASLLTVVEAWVYASDRLESKLTIPFNSLSQSSTYDTVYPNFLALSYSIFAKVLYF